MMCQRIAASLAVLLTLGANHGFAQEKPPVAETPTKKVPSGAVALVNGQPITRAEYHARLLQKHRGAAEMESVFSQLTNNHLILQEMKRRKIEISDADVEKKFQSLSDQVKAQSQGKTTLEAEMERTGVSMSEFRSQLRYLVGLEALARADFGIAAAEAVPSEKLNLWLAEKRGKATIQKENLPDGVALAVNAEPVYDDEAAQALEKSIGKAECRATVNELIGMHLVQARMREQSITVSPDDVDAEVEVRRKQFAKNPRFAGVDFAQFLQATRQQTLEQMKADEEFRAQVGLKKLVLKQNDAAALEKYFEDNKDLYGPLTRASHILIVASDAGPNGAKPPRTFDEGKAEIEKVQSELQAGGDFATLAKNRSEDTSRAQGGDVGYFPPKGMMDEAFAAAATKLEIGAVSAPVRSSAGWHLIKVTDRKPLPPFAEVRDEVIASLARKLYKEIVGKAEITVEP